MDMVCSKEGGNTRHYVYEESNTEGDISNRHNNKEKENTGIMEEGMFELETQIEVVAQGGERSNEEVAGIEGNIEQDSMTGIKEEQEEAIDYSKLPQSRWPLHIKGGISRIDCDMVSALATATDRTTSMWRQAAGWLFDPQRYDGVPVRSARDVKYTKISSAGVRDMVWAQIVKEIHPSRVLGSLRVFTVAEPAKLRLRILKEPRDINDYLGRETLQKIDIATKKEIIGLVHKGSFAVSLDMCAYFDQFRQHDEIARRMCFKKGRKFYCALTGCMGQRQMPEVGHCCMQVWCDFPGKTCASLACIDNAIFVGGGNGISDIVERDAATFVDRVALCNGTINENTSNIAKLVWQVGEWCGVALDLREDHKTVGITGRVREKIKMSIGFFEEWTLLQVAAHFGLLFWTIGLNNVFPGDYYDALKYYAALCREFSVCEKEEGQEAVRDFWRRPAEISEQVEEQLRRWTRAVLEAPPRRVQPPGAAPTWIVMVDSCARGWGYFAYNPYTTETRHGGAPWTSDFVEQYQDRLHQSVFTEPNGLVKALCHLIVHSGEHQYIHVLTDNVPTKAGGNKGFSVSGEAINEAMQRVRNYFPPQYYTFTYGYLPGKLNVVADAHSRGMAVTAEALEGAAAISQELLLGGLQLDGPQL